MLRWGWQVPAFENLPGWKVSVSISRHLFPNHVCKLELPTSFYNTEVLFQSVEGKLGIRFCEYLFSSFPGTFTATANNEEVECQCKSLIIGFLILAQVFFSKKIWYCSPNPLWHSRSFFVQDTSKLFSFHLYAIWEYHYTCPLNCIFCCCCSEEIQVFELHFFPQ